MSVGELVFVDTHVLLYVRDLREPGKERAAAAWMGRPWETRRGRTSQQVLQEYYVPVTGKLGPGLPREEAREDVLALRSWLPASPSLDLLEGAWEGQDRWGFSFWDSLIVAAARVQECTVLLTEDLSHDHDLGGLRILSPFREEPPD